MDLTSDTPVGSSAPNSKLQEEGQKTENGPACVCRFLCLCPQRHKHNSRLSTCRGSGGNRLVGRERRAPSRSTLHVADSANHRIRAIDDFDASPLVVTTVAGHRAAFGEVASSRDGIDAGASRSTTPSVSVSTRATVARPTRARASSSWITSATACASCRSRRD